MTATLARQGGRYILVGVGVYLTDFLVYAVLVRLAPDAFLFANAAGKLVGAGLGFVLHGRFTFAGAKRDRTGRQMTFYAGLLLFNLALSSALLWLAVARLGLHELAVRVVVDGLVVAMSFLGMRLFVYRPA